MIRSQVLVDYERYRNARVVIFIDSSNAAQAHRLLVDQAPAVERLAAYFSARVVLAEGSRLAADSIVENDLADAWIVIGGIGRHRALATKKNPQCINVDTDADWEPYAFKEILRQVRETTRIEEEVTNHYRQFNRQKKEPVVGAGVRPN